MENYEIPLGLGMMLAQNPTAMQKFSELSLNQKQELISGTHAVNSKEEMRSYVENKLSAF